MQEFNPGVDKVWSSFDKGQRPERMNQHSAVLEFENGDRALKYDTESSDTLSFSEPHKYLESSSKNITILATKSGNSYIVSTIGGRHAVIDTGTGRAVLAPKGEVFPEVVFGRPWETPGFKTSRVEAAITLYEGGAAVDRNLDSEESPFEVARDAIEQQKEKLRERGEISLR